MNLSKLSTVVAICVLAGLGSGCVPLKGESKESSVETVAAPVQEKVTIQPAPAKSDAVIVVIDTSMGKIEAELWPKKAPKTVANFLSYAEDKFFDGLIFHRVIDGFMIQGGGFEKSMRQKTPKAPIVNEARADTPNAKGTLAMARTMNVNSATAQFFVNLKDNAFLDHKNKTQRGYGYCVFGKVTSGMDVVDKIAKVRTKRFGQHEALPVTPVVINSIRRK